MAAIVAVAGIKTAFSGGADTIECNFSPMPANGVQIEASGFTLNNSTITVKGASGGDPDTIAFTESKHIAVLSSSNSGIAKISQAKLSGVTAGSWFVTFTPL